MTAEKDGDKRAKPLPDIAYVGIGTDRLEDKPVLTVGLMNPIPESERETFTLTGHNLNAIAHAIYRITSLRVRSPREEIEAHSFVEAHHYMDETEKRLATFSDRDDAEGLAEVILEHTKEKPELREAFRRYFVGRAGLDDA